MNNLRWIQRGAMIVGLLGLAACGDNDVRLPGKRDSLRQDDPRLAQDRAPVPLIGQGGIKPAAITLPKAQANSSWTHRNGSPAHRITHPALGRTLAPLWQAPIGNGNTRKLRITAEPIVAGGRIFALDSGALVTALSTAGAPLWTRDLTPGGERAGEGSGGGLAFGDGQLVVSTGFGHVTALNPETGAVLWDQRLGASGAAAPTVYKGLVYIVDSDSQAWALNSKTGRIVWTISGVPGAAGLVGGAAPAVNDRLVFLPFGSGEIVGAFRKGGVRLWGAPVSGKRPGRVYARIDDITGDPVVVGNRVYVGNQSGRTLALDANNGERLWTAQTGSYGPVWPAGQALFLVNDLGQLVRLDARNGTITWAVQLPDFAGRNERQKRKARAVYAHYGPILAGGRLIVASSDGYVRSFDPRNGALLSQIEIPGGAAANPVVVANTLYIVSGKGVLHAFR